MKHILLIATGGTIASKYTENGLAPQISAEEIISYVPSSKEFCTIDTVSPFSLDSTNVESRHWLTLAKLIEKKYEYYDGFVICHGTDTMAYTAAALSYLIQNNRKPIVITGSQKPIDLAITDARSNLLDSLRFASDDRAHGVSIVFGGQVIAGTRAKKIRSKSYNAFSSINFPEIANIHDQRIIFYIDDKEQILRPLKFSHEMNPKIFLLKLVPGMNATILDALFESYDGVIIESFGVGGLPDYGDSGFYKAIERWSNAGKIIVMATQVTHEGSDMTIYQVGKELKEHLENFQKTQLNNQRKLENNFQKSLNLLQKLYKPQQNQVIRLFTYLLSSQIQINLYTKLKMQCKNNKKVQNRLMKH